MGKSGWGGWDNPSEGFSDARGAGRYDPEGHFGDAAVDKALDRLGGDADRVIRALRRELDKLPKAKRAKAERRIRTRAHKRGQGGGGTPMIDSKGY